MSCTLSRIENSLIRDLDLLTIGMVMDIWTEKANDDVKYQQIATQEDFDKF